MLVDAPSYEDSVAANVPSFDQGVDPAAIFPGHHAAEEKEETGAGVDMSLHGEEWDDVSINDLII